MNNENFWAVIEEAKLASDDIQKRPSALKTILIRYPADEIISFVEKYHEQLARSYSWELWGAAYVINGGCSDDGFDYFRDWLISEGQAIFERALLDAESLAALEALEEPELEEYRYAQYEAHEAVASGEMPDFKKPPHAQPIGNEWDEDNLEALYPKLTAVYG